MASSCGACVWVQHPRWPRIIIRPALLVSLHAWTLTLHYLALTHRLPASDNPEVYTAQQTMFEAWSIVGEQLHGLHMFAGAPPCCPVSFPPLHAFHQAVYLAPFHTHPCHNAPASASHNALAPLHRSARQPATHIPGLLCLGFRLPQVTPLLMSASTATGGLMSSRSTWWPPSTPRPAAQHSMRLRRCWQTWATPTRASSHPSELAAFSLALPWLQLWLTALAGCW